MRDFPHQQDDTTTYPTGSVPKWRDLGAGTCGWVFPSGRGVQYTDYHSNMNGENFMKWINESLVPCFKARYGTDMNMILILDNASYHWGREGNDSFLPLKQNKEKCLNKISELADCTNDCLSYKFTRPIDKNDIAKGSKLRFICFNIIN